MGRSLYEAHDLLITIDYNKHIDEYGKRNDDGCIDADGIGIGSCQGSHLRGGRHCCGV